MTRIKVCGLRRQEDVDACLAAGVNYVGFIFVPSSPRFLAPSEAGRLESGGAERVGVFADAPLDEVLKTAITARLDRIQLHGDEPPDYALRVGAERVIKTFWPLRVEGAELERQLAQYAPSAAFFLFDAGRGGGGHGVTFDPERLGGLTCPRPFFIAGGLGIGNVGKVIERLKPFAVDLNSALESAPGLKDPRKIKEAVKKIHNAPA